MSHELRTPLNSILILGQQLGDNSGRQPLGEAGRVRPHHPRRRDRPASNLITDILDLSKIESGTVTVMAESVVVEVPGRGSGRAHSATRRKPGTCRSTFRSTSMLSRTHDHRL